MFHKPAPKGFTKVERPAKAAAKPPSPARSTKPHKTIGPVTARITTADVVQEGSLSELRFTTTDESGAVLDHVITLEHPDSDTQYEGQQLLARLVTAAGLNQIEDSAELRGRTIVITSDGFAPPATRPDDEPPLPAPPDPAPRYANPPQPILSAEPNGPTEWERRYTERQERKAAAAEWDREHPELFEDSLAATPDDWPDWMDAEQDDAA